MKTVEMKLRNEPFQKIKDGRKTIELRLFDEKRQQIDIGDEIIFTNTEDENQKIAVLVIGLSRFGNFEKLFSCLDPIKSGWEEVLDIPQMAAQMHKYYSYDEIMRYGALGIHIQIK